MSPPNSSRVSRGCSEAPHGALVPNEHERPAQLLMGGVEQGGVVGLGEPLAPALPTAPPRYRGPGPAEGGATGHRSPLPPLSDQGVTEPRAPPAPPSPPVAAAAPDVAVGAPLLRPPPAMTAAETASASPPLPPLPPAPPVCSVVRAGSSSMVWSSNMIPPGGRLS